MKQFLFLPLILLSIIATGQVQLSKEEQALVKIVEEQLPGTLKTLAESVNINSGTFNVKGVRAVGALYRKELEALGFTVEWIYLPDSLKRAGHLVATRKGKRGKKLFLIGHLDTVFEPDMPKNPWTVLNDSTATGQGANDMKGGDMIVIGALKALHQLGLLNEVNITVYFTGDEENAAEPREISRGDFIARAKQHDIALAFEGASNLNTVATARRGASGWKLEVEGRQGHSSGIFTNGYGAIYEAARIVNSFRETLSTEQYLSFNPGLFIGGSDVSYTDSSQSGATSGKTNIISPRTVVIGDLRFLSEPQKEAARYAMRLIAAQSLPGTKATISFEDGIPSMPPTPGNTALAAKLSEVSLALGYGEVQPGNPGSRGAGDISYVAEYLDCLDGLGAMGRGAHAPGETIDLKTFPVQIKRTAVLIYRLTR